MPAPALPQIDPGRCTGCGWCVAACPPHVLSLHAGAGRKAAALDDASEDDVLALSGELDVRELVEDELLLALPLVPRHDVCPGAVRLSAQDADFDAAGDERPHPFAGLAALKAGKPH